MVAVFVTNAYWKKQYARKLEVHRGDNMEFLNLNVQGVEEIFEP